MTQLDYSKEQKLASIPESLWNTIKSPTRREQIVKFAESTIAFPRALLPLHLALSELLYFYEPAKAIFLAAGVLEENRNSPEANLFNTVFGRDSLVQLQMAVLARQAFDSLRMLASNGEVDAGYYNRISLAMDVLPNNIDYSTVEYLASRQGMDLNANSEEESGKILHEDRDGSDEIARELNQHRQWEWPYYGSIDATLEYIVALGQIADKDPGYLETTYKHHFNGDIFTYLQSMEMAIDCVITWIQNSLIVYKRLNPKGIEIQSWRDSFDSISSRVKGIVPNFNEPIALLDLQYPAFEALIVAAKHFSLVANVRLNTKARLLNRKASEIREKIFRTFWIQIDEDNGYFAKGIQMVDGKTVLFDAVSSSNLRILNSSIFEGREKHREMIINYTYDLLICKYGIRSLAPDSNRYHSSGYHTGNVWLFDTILSAVNLASLGHLRKGIELVKKVEEIVLDTKMYPELVGSEVGYNTFEVEVIDIDDNVINKISQPGQPLQGWTVLAYLLGETLKPIWEKNLEIV